MGIFDRIGTAKSGRGNDGSRKFRLELTKSGFISLLVVGVLGFVWVFFLGVMVGRGYKPEEAVPELAHIIPQPKNEVAQSVVPEPVKVDYTPLKPEELQFMEQLKSEEAQKSDLPTIKTPAISTPEQKVESQTSKTTPTAVTAQKETQAPPVQPGTRPDPAPPLKKPRPVDRKPVRDDVADKRKNKSVNVASVEIKPGEIGRTRQKPKPETKKVEPADNKNKLAKDNKKNNRTDKNPKETKKIDNAEKRRDSKTKIYNYTYQVGAFSSREQANSFKSKMGRQGFQSSVEMASVNGATVYRVMVHLKSSVKDVRGRMKATGVADYRLRGKVLE